MSRKQFVFAAVMMAVAISVCAKPGGSFSGGRSSSVSSPSRSFATPAPTSRSATGSSTPPRSLPASPASPPNQSAMAASLERSAAQQRAVKVFDQRAALAAGVGAGAVIAGATIASSDRPAKGVDLGEAESKTDGLPNIKGQHAESRSPAPPPSSGQHDATKTVYVDSGHNNSLWWYMMGRSSAVPPAVVVETKEVPQTPAVASELVQPSSPVISDSWEESDDDTGWLPRLMWWSVWCVLAVLALQVLRRVFSQGWAGSSAQRKQNYKL